MCATLTRLIGSNCDPSIADTFGQVKGRAENRKGKRSGSQPQLISRHTAGIETSR